MVKVLVLALILGPSMSGFTVLGDTDGEITYRMMVADDVDKVIASLTSAFSGEKTTMTKREKI